MERYVRKFKEAVEEKEVVEWDKIPRGTQKKINILDQRMEDIRIFGKSLTSKEKLAQLQELQAEIDKLESPYLDLPPYLLLFLHLQ